LDTVLETRYAFLEEMSRPAAGTDFVRQQFIDAWEMLHPVFRRHLSDEAASSVISALAFFTASDALKSLDALGPGLGIEITSNGFSRLVRLLITDKLPAMPASEDQNPRLRQLLGLQKWEGLKTGALAPGIKRFAPFALTGRLVQALGPAQAMASTEEPKLPSQEAMAQWLFVPPELDDHLKAMLALLNPLSRSVLQKSRLPEKHHPLFQRLVLATAWQETCFRHYIRNRAGGITYLVSYNDTSVGIMQINERVWKGIYDIRRLRWDIQYNAAAGCEILDIYVNRYALRYMKTIKDAQNLSDEMLTGSIYAMYNGGPRQFKKFLARSRNNTLYKSDKLFRQKYHWVNQELWQHLSDCLL
jgi:hypothetical protein